MDALCPPEIWSMIFAMACTDGGHTGCALSLVSKNVRAASAHLQMQSIAIEGLETMKVLLRELRRRPASERCVRYLLIADTWAIIDPDDCGAISGTDIEEYSEVSQEILKTVAPSLHVLTLPLHGGCFGLGVLLKLPINFPLLRSLTIAGRMAQDDLWKPSSKLTVLACLPKIERVHLFKSVANTPSVELLLGTCKTLRHIHITSYSIGPYLPIFKQAATSQSASRLPSLRYVTVGPDHVQDYISSNFSLQYNRDIAEWTTLEHQNEGRMLKILLSPTRLAYGDREAKRDWLDVIDGGLGCWVTTKDELAARAVEISNEVSGLSRMRVDEFYSEGDDDTDDDY